MGRVCARIGGSVNENKKTRTGTRARARTTTAENKQNKMKWRKDGGRDGGAEVEAKYDVSGA